MLPGPNLVYKCPNCGSLILKGSLLSGNTFDAEVYSDGKVISEMLTEYPDLTECIFCNKIFWLHKLEVYQRLEWSEIPNERFYFAVSLNINDLFRALDEGVAETKKEELYIRRSIWWRYNDSIRERVGETGIWGKRGKRKKKREGELLIFTILDSLLENKSSEEPDNKNFMEQQKEENSETSVKDEKLMIQFSDENDENRWKENLLQMLMLLDPSEVTERIAAAEIHRNLGNFEKSIEILESIESPTYDYTKVKLLEECSKKNRWLIRLW